MRPFHSRVWQGGQGYLWRIHRPGYWFWRLVIKLMELSGRKVSPDDWVAYRLYGTLQWSTDSGETWHPTVMQEFFPDQYERFKKRAAR